MEFDELVKIWSTQDNKPLYAINEEALHKRIRAKSKSTGRVAGINEAGLIAIAAGTGGYLFIDAIRDGDGIYSYLAAITMMFIAGYVLTGRIRRKRVQNQFDRSMLGELDQAIANADYLVSFAKTFVLWFLLPAGITTLLSMIQGSVPVWKWLVIPVCFSLSYLLVRWELRRVHIPRKRNLEALRNTLISNSAENQTL